MHSTLVTAATLNKNLNSDWVIIDCRFSLADTTQGEKAFAESRIPAARYAHLDRHLSSKIVAGVTGRHPLPDKETLAAQFRAWGIKNNTQLVAYDDKAGAVASRFWWLSRWLGHLPCAVLDGGFAQWQKNGFKIETGDAFASTELAPSKKNASAVEFKVTPALVQSVNRGDVHTQKHEYILIDAREKERFDGDHEPIDAVAGRIPGALNFPFMENLASSGQFKSAAELKKRFAGLVREAQSNKDQHKSVVHYCGSGVTAAHNMLAMAHAGMEPGALYAGSFSEWITPAPDGEQYPVAPRDD